MSYHKTRDGLIIATDVIPSAETFSINVLVKTGSRHERPENGGISHYLEHMAFKGTRSRTAAQIAEEFDMIGGHFNAYTSHERTVYYAKVLKDNKDKALDILSDIIQNSIFDEQELERERKVILEELAQTKDLPDEIVFNLFQEIAFPEQPLGRPIIGDEDFIKTVTRDDLRNYVDTRYGPNNIIIAAAGNFDSDQFTKECINKFSSLPNQSKDIILTSKYAGGEKKIQKDLEQVHIVLGFSGVSYSDEDYYTQQVLTILTGGGMSSRLFQEIREKRGLAYHISAFSSSYQDTGTFGIYSATHQSSVSELIEATIEQLQIITKNINEEEIMRAKAQVKSSLLMSQESSSARSERLASNYAIFNRFIPVSELIEEIERIDKNSLQNMMIKLLNTNSKPTLAVVGNIQNDLIDNSLLESYRL